MSLDEGKNRTNLVKIYSYIYLQMVGNAIALEQGIQALHVRKMSVRNIAKHIACNLELKFLNDICR